MVKMGPRGGFRGIWSRPGSLTGGLAYHEGVVESLVSSDDERCEEIDMGAKADQRQTNYDSGEANRGPRKSFRLFLRF